MLVCSTISSHEADLGQGVLEADLFGCASVLDVGFQIPVGALRDFADNESAGNVRHPVSKLHTVWVCVDLVMV